MRDAHFHRVLYGISGIVVLCAIISSFASRSNTLSNSRSYYDLRTGVEIRTKCDADMFPASWTDDDSPTTAANPQTELIPEGIKGVQSALKKYPAGFLKKNLVRVYLVQNLVVDGVETGGVNSPDLKTIYVDLDNVTPQDEAVWAEETIHHEFAHLLTDNHPGGFSEDTWAKLNSPGFRYGNGGTEAIRSGTDGGDITEDFLRRGFAEQYGMSDAYEDFATLAERMFVGDRLVRLGMRRYPVIKTKAAKIITFYHDLDPVFTSQYFASLPTVSVQTAQNRKGSSRGRAEHAGGKKEKKNGVKASN